MSRVRKRPLAHPTEPGYPCYVSVLGELAWMAPREEPLSTVAESSRGGHLASRVKSTGMIYRGCSRKRDNHQENSPSGLWRQLGKLVGCKPSGVRIPHSPPVRNARLLCGRFCFRDRLVGCKPSPRAGVRIPHSPPVRNARLLCGRFCFRNRLVGCKPSPRAGVRIPHSPPHPRNARLARAFLR